MRELIILGLGAHGPEMAEIVEAVNRVKETWHLRGFISPDGHRVGESINGYPVLGTMDVLRDYPDAAVVPHNEGGYRLNVPPDQRSGLVSLIHPSAVVSRTATIGVGCVIYPHCYVGLNARINDFVFCLSGCIINHDDVIEERVILASGVTLAGAVHVESDCYLGQGCQVRQYLRISQNSSVPRVRKADLIGMGAVVVKDVPPNSVMVGNPARKLRERTPQRGG